MKPHPRNRNTDLRHYIALLHFARVVDEAKCILITGVCVCVSVCPLPHATLLRRPGCNEWYGCPLVVYCWADLQSVHGFRCYNNIAANAKFSECLYSLHAWYLSVIQ